MMAKRKSMASEEMIFAVLALIVVFVLIGTNLNLIKSPLAKLLGKADISSYNPTLVNPSDIGSTMNTPAMQSTRALLYSINTLAVKDTHGKKLDKIDTQFGDVKVETAMWGMRVEKLKGTQEEIRLKLARLFVKCYIIFEDNARKNGYCFDLDTSAMGNTAIDPMSKDDFKKLMDDYIDSSECKQDPKCASRAKELRGGNWINIFNWQNLGWDIDTLNSKTKQAKICADNTDLNQIHITNLGTNCKPDTSTVEDRPLELYISNFNLPQDIVRSSGALGVIPNSVESWLKANGDPQYILFYEKFPEGEDAYWKMSAFETGWKTLLMTEAGFFIVFDAVIPYGVGPIVKPIVTPIYQAFKKVFVVGGKLVIPGPIKGAWALFKGVLDVGESAMRGVANTALKLFRFSWEKFSFVLGKQIAAKDFLKENSEALVKQAIKSLEKATKKPLAEADKEILQRFYTQAAKDMKEIPEAALEGGVKRETLAGTVDDAFKILKQDPDELLHELTVLVGKDATEIDVELAAKRSFQQKYGISFDEFKQLQATLGKNTDSLVTALKEATLDGIEISTKRSITRTAVMKTRVVKRTVSDLRETVTRTLTNEEKDRILAGLLKSDESLTNLARLNPAKARDMLAQAEDVASRIVKDDGTIDLTVNGLVPPGAIDDKFADLINTKGAAAITEKFDEILARADFDKLRYGVQVQRFTRTATGTAVDFATTRWKRHVFCVGVALAAMKLESTERKNYPIGVNAIGLLESMGPEIVYDDEFTADFKTWDKIKPYLEIQGDIERQIVSEDGKTKTGKDASQGYNERYLSLLPDVKKYYLSLTKDQNAYWFDQWPDRFHLVSPCKADIQIKVSRCECWGPVQPGVAPGSIGKFFGSKTIYETGKPSSLLKDVENPDIKNGEVKNFDGQNPMQFEVDRDMIIKRCDSKGWFVDDVNDPYKPLCIKINPIMEDSDAIINLGGETNYCYHGSNVAMQTANGVLNFGLPIGATLLCTGGSPIAMGVCGAIGGAVGSISYAILNTNHQWPNHD